MNQLPQNLTRVALDYETALLTGEPSVDFYRPDFRVKSMALSYRDPNGIHSLYFDSEESSKTILEEIAKRQIQVVVHNLAFEYGVTKNRFPDLDILWHADTMRLVQNADNGGSSAEEDSLDAELGNTDNSKGLGLTKCVQRWLPEEYHNHKEPFHKTIRDQGIKKGHEGKNLNLLSPQQLKDYNTADSVTTLLLYEQLSSYLAFDGFDPDFDHYLYRTVCKLISDSRSRGVVIDRSYLTNSVVILNNEIQSSISDFRAMFLSHINDIEEEKRKAYLNAYKSEKGRLSAEKAIREDASLIEFNINSSKDKEALFVNRLKIQPNFLTESGKPSFAKAFLGQWGAGGKLLKKRGTLSISKSQCETLLEKSSYDGKWHIDLMAAGTTTGRFKGAGGLNVQAMSRRDPLLMRAIKPSPGSVFVSVDLSAGEPTITTEFSKDSYYHAATFGMVGKEPYFDASGVLLIDDIYLMGMSVSPMGKERILDAFYADKFNGLSFSEAWMKDPEIVKTALKTERAFHKILILGLGYAMGPQHMVDSAFKAGYQITLKEAKGFFKAYWQLFSDVKGLGKKLEVQLEQQGSLTNIFGYRLLPDKPYKALNYFIQSSVSGLINVLCAKYFTICKKAQFVTVIHDEIIFEIPRDSVEECKTLFNKALTSLNEDLNWSVKVRCGWKEGNDFYEAK